MDAFEREFVALLDEAVPDPDRGLDPDAVISAARTARRARGRRRAALGSGVAVVALIGAGSWVITDNKSPVNHDVHGPPPVTPAISTAPPSPPANPVVLTSSPWQIWSVRHAGDTPVPASGPVIFSFQNGTSTDHLNGSAVTTISPGHVRFGRWTVATSSLPPWSRLDGQQQPLVYDLLSGTLRWSVAGKYLTMSKPGVGAVVFVRSHYRTHVPAGFVRGSIRSSGGPSGASPQLMSGQGHLTFRNRRTGRAVMLDTRDDGHFGGFIPTGTYFVTAQTPSYESGKANCAALHPVTVATGATTSFTVYCQEK